MVAVVIIVPLILYGLGAATISLLGGATKTESQKKSYERDRKNPLICMLWGIPAILILPLLFLDHIFNFKGTGYYDGREL